MSRLFKNEVINDFLTVDRIVGQFIEHCSQVAEEGMNVEEKV